MSATVRVGRDEATVTNGVWRSKDKLFARMCEAKAWQLVPDGYTPDPDLAAAERVADALAGRVIRSSPSEIVVEGRVY